MNVLPDGRILLTGRISYWPKGAEPLCAEVFVIRGEVCTWLFDVGNGQAAAERVQALPGPKKVVISHFHPDHMGNWDRVTWQDMYLGDFAHQKTGQGTIVTAPITVENGIRIFPLPSSHAKGSLGLEVDDVALLGDGAYCTMKGGQAVHNATLLQQEIAVLEGLSVQQFVLSHAQPLLQDKTQVLADLRAIYARRMKNEAYIPV